MSFEFLHGLMMWYMVLYTLLAMLQSKDAGGFVNAIIMIVCGYLWSSSIHSGLQSDSAFQVYAIFGIWSVFFIVNANMYLSKITGKS